MQLPNNWYYDKFMGFAICVVSDLETTWLSVDEGYLQEMPGISIEFTIKSHHRRSTSCLMSIGFVGINKNVASDHTCLAYVPFEEYWSIYKNHLDSPNNWYQIDFSANSLRKHILLKSWGIRLLYTDDLQDFTSWVRYFRWGVFSVLYSWLTFASIFKRIKKMLYLNQKKGLHITTHY